MSQVIRAILTGAGSIAGAWLKPLAARNDVEIVAVADPVETNAKQRIAEFELKSAYYPTLAEALAKEHADAVFDCSIPGAHCANALAALAAGCHVLSEKPLAETVADAQKIVAASFKAKKIHAVIQNRRYLNEIISYRDAVRHNIGDLTTLNADFYLGAHFGGFRDRMRHVLLLDMAIHSFDQARFLSGCDPVSVFCKEWNPKGSWYRHDASAIAIFTMTDNVIFTYRGSWCAEGCNTSWECDWRAVGTGGSVLWRGTEIAGETVKATGNFLSEMTPFTGKTPELKDTGHAGCIAEFISCLQTGKTPQTVCTDNIKSLAMVEAAIESAAAGREITITL